MVACLKNNELKRIWKKSVVALSTVPEFACGKPQKMSVRMADVPFKS
jgi:hypothetical protein